MLIGLGPPLADGALQGLAALAFEVLDLRLQLRDVVQARLHIGARAAPHPATGSRAARGLRLAAGAPGESPAHASALAVCRS